MLCNNERLVQLANQVPHSFTQGQFNNAAAGIISAAFDDRNSPDVLEKTELMMASGSYFRPGLFNAFQYWVQTRLHDSIDGVFSQRQEALIQLVNGGLEAAVKKYNSEDFLNAAEEMIRASAAVYTLLGKHRIDRRPSLEEVLTATPDPVLRIPSFSTLSPEGMIIAWDRFGALLVYDDLMSPNMNRIRYGVAAIKIFASYEAESGSRITTIRDVASLYPNLEPMQMAMAEIVPERGIDAAGASRVSQILLNISGITGFITKEVYDFLTQTVEAKVLKRCQEMSAYKLRQLFEKQRGRIAGMPPMSVYVDALVEVLKMMISESKMTRENAAAIIGNAQSVVSTLIPLMHGEELVPGFSNPFLN